MNRPVGSIESQKEYLLTEMDDLGRYTRKRLDFIRYYRSELVRDDELFQTLERVTQNT